MIKLAEIVGKLNQIDQTLSLWFRRNVVADGNEKAKRATDSFNAWASQSAEELEAERKQLDKQLEELNRFLAEIEASSQRLSQPDHDDLEAIERHNRLVAEHNVQVKRHRELVGAYTERHKDYNRRVQERNTDLKRREHELEAVQEAVRKEFHEYESWRKARGEEQFFREVNRLYVALHETLPEAGANAGTVKAYLNQVRLVRKELATYARRREQEAENGVLIVPAILSSDEECHLVVDPGACPYQKLYRASEQKPSIRTVGRLESRSPFG